MFIKIDKVKNIMFLEKLIHKCRLMREEKNNVKNFLDLRDFESDKDYLHEDVPLTKNMNHDKWKQQLISQANKNRWRVLEIGSRGITSKHGLKPYFTRATHVGFDFYKGESVDVVGDAHFLSSYFEIEEFDLVISASVFEHLAMPWIVAEEIAEVLKVNGYLFIETHYCYNSHSRPWHFFQFSEQALKILFSENLGFECIECGVDTPIVSRFSTLNPAHLRDIPITGMYCHSEFFGRKVARVKNFNWRQVDFKKIIDKPEINDPFIA